MATERAKLFDPEKGSLKVNAYMESLDHPLKPAIEAVRQIIVQANSQMSEQIKWNAPSFCYQGEDRVTMNLRGRGYFMLVFHCGAKSKDRHGTGRLIDDATGWLKWAADDRATAQITGLEDVQEKRELLTELVNRWTEAAG